jgi:hypothetical protein
VRIPSWTRGYQVRINGHPWEPLPLPPDRQTPVATACGYAPHGAFYVPIRRTWTSGDTVELALPMPIVVRRPSPRVQGSRSTAAITRGPLVYCLESVDNPGVDLFTARVDLATLTPHHTESSEHGGMRCRTITGRTVEGVPLTFIPYYAWANRGPSQMNAMVSIHEVVRSSVHGDA